MTMTRKKFLIVTAAIALIFIIGMTFAAFFDFEISSVLTSMKETNEYISMSFPIPAIAVSIISALPACILFAICAAIVMRGLIGFKKAGSYAGAAAMAVTVCLCAYFFCTSAVENVKFMLSDSENSQNSDIIITVALTIITSLAVIACALMMSQKNAARLFVPAIVCTASLIILSLVLILLGLLFGRANMRDILLSCDMTAFTKWFAPKLVPGGLSLAYVSTAGAASLALIPMLYSKKQKKRMPLISALTYAVVAVWTVITSLIGMVLGVQYLSDCLIGAMLALCAVTLAHYFMRKIIEA
jgi:hypothetical protein